MRKNLVSNPKAYNYLMMLEDRHVVNRFSLDLAENEFYNFCNKIYNYFRHEAIEKMNKFLISGQPARKIEVDIPEKYLTAPSGLKLESLKIVYTPQISDVSMRTKKNYLKKGIIIEINDNFFFRNFKLTFIHELRHFVQYSAGEVSIYDLYNNINVNKEISPNIQFLIRLLNFIVPMERNAYPEQIYNDAFSEAMLDEDIHKVGNQLISAYAGPKKFWNELMKDIKENKELYADYICHLFFININSLVIDKHDMKLFDSQLYNDTHIKELRKMITTVGHSGGDIIEVINKATEELKKSELLNLVIESYCRRIDYYRDKFVHNLTSVVSQAYEDAKKAKSYKPLQIYLGTFSSFIRSDGEKYILEAIVSDNKNKCGLIVEIKGKNETELYNNFNILRNSVSENLVVVPGFQELNAPLNVDDFVLSFGDFEKVSNIKDIPKLVDDINKEKS